MPYSAEILDGEWTQEWLEMPEFHQEDLSPYRTIYVHFRSEEDVQEFEKTLGQKIYPSRKYYWYPEKEENSYKNKRYVDES